MSGELIWDVADGFTLGEDSPARPLHQLTELVAARFPGCPDATATLREPGEVAAMAATHPGLVALAAGVRPSATIFHAYDPLGLTLSLYGVRTGAEAVRNRSIRPGRRARLPGFVEGIK